MNLLKKAGAILLAACTALSGASCGENTANAMTVNGFDVRAGIYLYYATSAYGEAVETLRKGGETFEDAKTSEDYKKILDKADIDNVKAEEWIQNKAEEYCKTFVAIENEFDQLGLSLTSEQIAAADSSAANSMNYYGEFFAKTGIGEQSVKDIILNSYKQDAVWEAYYGKDGSEGITEQELYDYYAENTFRCKYIEMPLKDGEGNLLKADGKAEIEKMANDFLKRLDKKKGSEADLMTEFNFLIEENDNYVTSLSAAAVTTTDEEGNTITTPTTAKITTDENGNTDTTEESAVTTTEAPKDEDAEDGEDTAAANPEDNTTTTTTTTAAEETTTTESGLGYSTDYERTFAISTSTEKAEKEDVTTTEPTYTPCEKVYNRLSDPECPLLKPELIKDDECYYIVVKMDIKERMTPDDIWTDSKIESVRSAKYYDTFLDKLKDTGNTLPNSRNKLAFRRYKVLDIDYLGYQQALMQSYYSNYGYGG